MLSLQSTGRRGSCVSELGRSPPQQLWLVGAAEPSTEDAQVSEWGCVGEQGDTTMHNTHPWAGTAFPFQSFLGFSCSVRQMDETFGELLPWVQPWTHLRVWGVSSTLAGGWVLLRNYNCPRPVTGSWVSNTSEEMNYKHPKLGGFCWRRGYC